jgi:hypothetical protein
VPEVEDDRCPAHGTGLDAGQLEAIAEIGIFEAIGESVVETVDRQRIGAETGRIAAQPVKLGGGVPVESASQTAR